MADLTKEPLCTAPLRAARPNPDREKKSRTWEQKKDGDCSSGQTPEVLKCPFAALGLPDSRCLPPRIHGLSCQAALLVSALKHGLAPYLEKDASGSFSKSSTRFLIV